MMRAEASAKRKVMRSGEGRLGREERVRKSGATRRDDATEWAEASAKKR